MSKTISLSKVNHYPYIPVTGKQQVYLLLELTGSMPASLERSPINLSIVLDRSGSMTGEPLHYCKEAAKFVVNQLTDEDMLSIVVFDDEIETVIPPQPVVNKDLLKKQIDGIETCGMTNLSGGLIQGCQHVLKQDVKKYVNRVILLSDGNANAGITEPSRLVKVVEDYQTAGVTITTMGVSNHFDEELMEAIADAGKGNFYFINQVEEIPKLFAEELEGILSVIAQNVSLKIAPKEGVELHELFGYTYEENSAVYTVTAGDMYAGEVKSVLLSCTLPAKAEGMHEILDIEWSFVDVTDGVKEYVFHESISLEYTEDLNKLSQSPNSHVEKQIQITESARTIEKAMELFDQGDFDEGKKLLYSQAERMSKQAEALKDEDLIVESEALFSQLEDFEYTKQKRKELHHQKYMQMKRRKR